MSQPSLSVVPDAILWHDGMLLRPEHFQEMTARGELLQQHHASAGLFHWGVSRMAVDDAAMLQGRFALLELEGRLPDGLAVSVGRDAAAPQLHLDALDPSFKQQPFYVYLAVLAAQRLEGGVERIEPSADPRFLAVADGDEALRTGSTVLPEGEEDELPPTPIPRLRPRLHLLAAMRGVSSKYANMPIARIGFRNGVWALDEMYVPPTERTLPASPLAQRVASTLRRVRELAMLTQERWRAMSAEERRSSSGEAANVRALSCALPACDALLATGAAHPFALYLSFCGLAGQVAAIAAEPVPPPFQPYDHTDPARSFSEVDAYLNHVLSEGDSREYTGFAMTYDGGAFSIAFAPDWADKRLVLALRASGSGEGGVAAWFDSALVGAHSLQQSMRERRVLGAPRTRLTTEPGLFAGTGVVLYHLPRDRDFVRVGEVLDVAGGPALPGSSVPVEITLYVKQTAS